MEGDTNTLGPDALQNFLGLRSAAIDAVTERFYATHGGVYAAFGARGRQACRDDLAFHLDFLRPVLEFGLIQPMVDYLRWLAVVLESRDIPAEHLPLSLAWLAEFFAARMPDGGGAIVARSLALTKTQYLLPDDAPTAIYAHMPQPWEECAAFEDALLAGDRRGAGALLDRCLDQGHSLVEAELHLIQPALYSVGRQWQNNQVTVAQEHLATKTRAAGVRRRQPSCGRSADGVRCVPACRLGRAVPGRQRADARATTACRTGSARPARVVGFLRARSPRRQDDHHPTARNSG